MSEPNTISVLVRGRSLRLLTLLAEREGVSRSDLLERAI